MERTYYCCCGEGKVVPAEGMLCDECRAMFGHTWEWEL